MARRAKHRKARSESVKALKFEVLSATVGVESPRVAGPAVPCPIPKMPTLDHVDDTGAKHRRETGLEGKTFYAWLKR